MTTLASGQRLPDRALRATQGPAHAARERVRAFLACLRSSSGEEPETGRSRRLRRRSAVVWAASAKLVAIATAAFALGAPANAQVAIKDKEEPFARVRSVMEDLTAHREQSVVAQLRALVQPLPPTPGNAQLQHQILQAAAESLAPGGQMRLHWLLPGMYRNWPVLVHDAKPAQAQMASSEKTSVEGHKRVPPSFVAAISTLARPAERLPVIVLSEAFLQQVQQVSDQQQRRLVLKFTLDRAAARIEGGYLQAIEERQVLDWAQWWRRSSVYAEASALLDLVHNENIGWRQAWSLRQTLGALEERAGAAAQDAQMPSVVEEVLLSPLANRWQALLDVQREAALATTAQALNASGKADHEESDSEEDPAIAYNAPNGY